MGRKNRMGIRVKIERWGWYRPLLGEIACPKNVLTNFNEIWYITLYLHLYVTL